MSDDTRSILSEEIKEEFPDPTEDLLKEMLLRQRKY